MFYASVQSTLEDVPPKHDGMLILRDFNAHFGKDNADRERITDRNGTGTMTDNGSRSSDKCGRMPW